MPGHHIEWRVILKIKLRITGKSLSEALIFASTNPQYHSRLFIEFQVQHMKIPGSNLGRICCVQKLFLTFRTISIFVHNMFSPCSGKRRASDKDLPVHADNFELGIKANFENLTSSVQMSRHHFDFSTSP